MRFIDDLDGEWLAFLRRELQVTAFVEHGLWFALATIARDCLSDTVATCVCLEAAMKQRSAQAITLYAMELGLPGGVGKEAFVGEERWQPARRYLERLAETPDWGDEVIADALAAAPAAVRRVRPKDREDASPRGSVALPEDDGDRVGIVMAKSAEGDAVAEILRGREGIEVLDQPSFWDIRARARL